MKSLKIKKTDKRFNLNDYGFTHFIEVDQSDWKISNQIRRKCRDMFKEEFFVMRGTVYTDGNWISQIHDKREKYQTRRTERFYFRGEKYITLLRMNLDMSEDTFYL